jgi:rieske iron-sulfur protein
MQRRGLLKGLCALGMGAPGAAIAQQGNQAGASARPAKGDVLVYAYGDKADQIIRPAELEIAAKQVFAFPMDATSGIARSADRLNQVVVIRLNPDWLSDATRARAADGIVAYSGVCTHTGCDIELWDAATRRFQCPCHESQFDPGDGARVVGGPAPWQLAALPITLVDDTLVVTDGFQGSVGFQQPGLNPFGL